MSESLTAHLIDLIAPLVTPLGYEIVHLEIQTGPQRVLRLYIDHVERTDGVGIQDCVNVAKALDEPLDLIPEVDKAFGGAAYELEVSSPGIDRPLRTERDFSKFKGREVRIHTFRPLSGDEMGNTEYHSKNPKQKNFLGTLQGYREGKVLIALNLVGGLDRTAKKPSKKGKAGKASPSTNSVEDGIHGPTVSIPLPLISKANIEPDIQLQLAVAERAV